MTLMTEIYRLRRTHAANFFGGQSSTCHSFEIFLTEMQSNVFLAFSPCIFIYSGLLPHESTNTSGYACCNRNNNGF